MPNQSERPSGNKPSFDRVVSEEATITNRKGRRALCAISRGEAYAARSGMTIGPRKPWEDADDVGSEDHNLVDTVLPPRPASRTDGVK
jgi:hypothetical protein